MTIAFDSVPSALRLPGVYIEFSGAPSQISTFVGKGLIIGQSFASGTVAAGVVTNVSASNTPPDVLFGKGSMLSQMIKAAQAAQPWLQLYAVGLADNAAGVASVNKMTWTGTATASGTLNVYIGGMVAQVAVIAGETAAQVVAALVAAINAVVGMPVVAAIDTNPNILDLTCAWKGLTGNNIDIRCVYYVNDTVPAGLSYSVAQTTAGAGNPDCTATLGLLTTRWYNWIAFPYTDATNLGELQTYLGAAFGPMEAIGGTAFTAYSGTLASIASFGATLNSQWMTVQDAGLSPTPPWLWAAVYMATAAASLDNDPSQQLRGLPLPGILAPAVGDRHNNMQRNTLLFDGIATNTVNANGQVLIECEISTYQTNAAGTPDPTWLYIQTPETLSRIRLAQTAYFNTNYPNWKLANDTFPVPAGQPIMQPKKVVAELIGLYMTFMANGWTQNLAQYQAGLSAQINVSNNNRVDVLDDPILIKNMRILAVHSEFS